MFILFFDLSTFFFDISISRYPDISFLLSSITRYPDLSIYLFVVICSPCSLFFDISISRYPDFSVSYFFFPSISLFFDLSTFRSIDLSVFYLFSSLYLPLDFRPMPSGAHRVLIGCSSGTHYDATLILPTPSLIHHPLVHCTSSLCTSLCSTHALCNRTICLVSVCYTFLLCASPHHTEPAIPLSVLNREE